MICLEKKEYIIDYWINKLGLDNIPIRILYAEDPQISKKHGFLGLEGYHNNCYWVIYTPEVNTFVLIHELGHIYLDKYLNRLYREGKPKESFNEEILHIKYAIIDSFTNYHLYKFPQFRISYMENIKQCWELKPKTNPFSIFLFWYIERYLCYNFILTPGEKEKLPNCNNSLIRTKNILKKKGKLTNQKIKQLEIHLNTFDKIKDTKDYNNVRNFISKGLRILDLWDLRELSKNIKLLK